MTYLGCYSINRR